MKKPRHKYKKEIKTYQIISIKKKNYSQHINLLFFGLNFRQTHTCDFTIQI